MSIAMKSYDDLQRFKDKTRTGGIDFKDMSAQNQPLEASNWAIIKQLSREGGDDDPLLSQAGSIAVPVPQAVKADEFDTSHIKPVVAQPGASQSMQIMQSSILNSLNSVVPEPKAAVLPAEREIPPVATLFEQLTPAPVALAPVQEAVKDVVKPAVISAPQTSAPAAVEPVRFDQLFAAKGTTATSHPAKDLPLQPLLEMIASCR
jgi:hypothetical protein